MSQPWVEQGGGHDRVRGQRLRRREPQRRPVGSGVACRAVGGDEGMVQEEVDCVGVWVW